MFSSTGLWHATLAKVLVCAVATLIFSNGMFAGTSRVSVLGANALISSKLLHRLSDPEVLSQGSQRLSWLSCLSGFISFCIQHLAGCYDTGTSLQGQSQLCLCIFHSLTIHACDCSPVPVMRYEVICPQSDCLVIGTACVWQAARMVRMQDGCSR